ncbi:MAG TPA: hypothetical protein VNW92_24670 [Polyangiaceae bacterium]|jgi:hypothetical protein|nr:hypothetical protein [Polyangiaceae bacterium]
MSRPRKRDGPRDGGPKAQWITQDSRKPTPLRQDDQGRRYSVVVDKRPGVRIVFSTKLEKAAADLTVVRLAAIGCRALAVPMMAIDAPGVQRRQ